MAWASGSVHRHHSGLETGRLAITPREYVSCNDDSKLAGTWKSSRESVFENLQTDRSPSPTHWRSYIGHSSYKDVCLGDSTSKYDQVDKTVCIPFLQLLCLKITNFMPTSLYLLVGIPSRLLQLLIQFSICFRPFTSRNPFRR